MTATSRGRGEDGEIFVEQVTFEVCSGHASEEGQ